MKMKNQIGLKGQEQFKGIQYNCVLELTTKG